MSLASQLSSKLGDSIGGTDGEVRYNCPFCQKVKGREDTKHHFYVNLAKRVYFCHRCSSSGTVRALFRKLNIKETVTEKPWLEHFHQMRIFTGEDYSIPETPFEEVEFPCEVMKIELGMISHNYLRSRNLTDDDIDHYKIVVGTSCYRKRILIPTFYAGKMVFWVARFYMDAEGPKYYNPPGRKRKNYIFNLDGLRERSDSVIVTEGVFSAMAVGRDAVALFGKFAAREQIIALVKADFKVYYVALDGDALPEALRLSEVLWRRGREVRLISLEEGQDPASTQDFRGRLEGATCFDDVARVRLSLGYT